MHDVIRNFIINFFRSKNKSTGLIPRVNGGLYEGYQRASDIGKIIAFLEWFPEDEEIISLCEEWAQAIWECFVSKREGYMMLLRRLLRAKRFMVLYLLLWEYVSYLAA